jgi:hypothetical protein
VLASNEDLNAAAAVPNQRLGVSNAVVLFLWPFFLPRHRASVLSLEARSTNLAAAPTIYVSSPPSASCSATTGSYVCVLLSACTSFADRPVAKRNRYDRMAGRPLRGQAPAPNKPRGDRWYSVLPLPRGKPFCGLVLHRSFTHRLIVLAPF